MYCKREEVLDWISPPFYCLIPNLFISIFMATMQHHVYFIQNLINQGPRSDDSRISNRLIEHALKQARARLIKLKLDKYDYIADSLYQPICVELEKKPYHDCSCVTDNNDCLVLRSKKRLPKDLVAKWGSTVQVMYLDGRSISKSSITQNMYSKYSLSDNPAKVGYFIEDGYIVILNNIKLKLIVVKAIWEDPQEATNYTDCSNIDDADCSKYSSTSFPIDSELVYPMYQLTLELLGVSQKFPEDTRNDSKAVEHIQAIDPNEAKR